MDMSECAWCGAEIEDAGVDHKGMIFCSRECVGEWDEDTLTTDDIDLDDLDFDERDLDDDEGLSDGAEEFDPVLGEEDF